MYANNGKISDRQTFRLYVFDLLGISTLLLPPYLAKLSGSDGVFAIGIGGLISFVYLLFLGKVTARMGMDLGTYLEQKTPGWIKNISFFLILVHCCLTAGFGVYVFGNLMQYSLVKDLNYFLILLATVIVSAYSVSGGLENRARVYEVLFWLILLPFVGMMFMSVGDFEVVHMQDFFESQPVTLVKSSYLVFLFFTPLFFFLFLNGKRDGKREEKKQGRSMITIVAWALFTAVFLLLGSYVLLTGCFGSKALANMRFPVITLMSTIQIKGTFLKRMDALMLAVWFFTLLALLNLHMHYGTEMLKKLCRKEKQWLVIPAAGLVLGIAWMLKTTTNGVDLFLDYYSYLAVPLMIIGPGLILCTGKKKKQAAMLLMVCLLGSLTGCQTAELENRCFPMMVTVDYDADKGEVLFYENFPNAQNENKTEITTNEIQTPLKGGENFAESKAAFESTLNKVVDYNHLKIIVLGKGILENEEAYQDMLKTLAKTEEFPRNTYVCVTDDIEALIALKKVLPQEVGTYLEEYLKNHEEKKPKLLSLGNLMDEEMNKDMILYAPYLETEDSYVIWNGYYEIGEK